MGGGSSSQQKPKQINKESQQQIRNQNQQNKQLKTNSKANSPKNSHKNSPKNSPRNRSSIPSQPIKQQSIPNNKVNSPQKITNANSNDKYRGIQQQDGINQKNVRKSLKEDKQVLQNIELFKTGQYKVGINLFSLTPNNQFPDFVNLQQIQMNYEALLKWNFDSKTKKWNFTLQKPQKEDINFIVNQRGQLIKGQEDKWQLFNPSLQQIPSIDSKFYKQQIIHQSLQRDDFWLPSFQTLKKNKKSLFYDWKQEPVERICQFPVSNYTIKSINQSTSQPKYQPYHEIRKYFQKESQDWHMTLDIVQNDYKFHSFLTWKILPSNQNFNFNQLLQRQKQVLHLKKQIYIHRMKILSQ